MIDLFPNETILFQWLLFMTALWALHFGIFRPALRLIRERGERTEGERQRAEQLMAHAESLLQACEQKIVEARTTGLKDRENRLREGEGKGREIVGQAREGIGKELDKMRHRLESSQREASLHLKQYAEELGKMIAEKVLERPLS